MRSIITASCLFLSVGCAAQIKPVHTSISHTTLNQANVTPAESKKTALVRQDFAMVTNQNDKMYLVLSSEHSDDIVSSSPVIMSYRENEVVLKERILKAPDAVAGWIGQGVSLFGSGQKRCEAQVKDVYLQGNLYIDSLEYPFGRSVVDEPMSESEFTQMAWESGRVLLVAELTNTGGCTGVSFGRLSSLGEPTLTTQKEATVSLEDQAFKAFRSLPEYKEIQADYMSGGYPSFNAPSLPLPSPVGSGEGSVNEGRDISERWENYEGARTDVQLFETKEKKQMISASIDIWYGCGDFEARLFALWEVKPDQSLQLIATSTNGIKPQELLDFNGDGSFEIIQDNQWYQLQSNNYQTMENLYIPWDVTTCGC
jgi:hypothetical protein